ncbi:MAG TPA: four helix bundle protein [Chitinophagales bacterium]|nr:four helix bundle protein [Chitinophagales bacterium]HQO90111.1 four helix bundle protein [Chitinophagales bacterium]
MKKDAKENIILRLTFEFSMQIIEFAESLESNRKFVIANQILKSGTSIGANVREAQNAESKADFIHKIKVAIKEAEETAYWLELCHFSQNYPDTEELQSKLNSIKLILAKIITTSKNKQ